MKISLIILILGTLAMSDCNKIQPSSSFFATYSLQDSLNEIEKDGLMKWTTSKTDSSAAGDPSPHRRQISARIRIKEPYVNQFDEKEFLLKLKESIKRSLDKAGEKIHSSGTGNDEFYFDYKQGKSIGSVEVVTTRVEKNELKLWLTMREYASNIE